jgi:hypothetical protein
MSERCKHVEKNGFNCGSYAFNLYKDGIDQGNLCDVHYWQAKALAQPEQEPVAWLSTDSIGERHLCFDKPLDNDPVQPLYTAPPQRTWVDLTDEEIDNINYTSAHMLAREVLAKFKEKNT